MQEVSSLHSVFTQMSAASHELPYCVFVFDNVDNNAFSTEPDCGADLSQTSLCLFATLGVPFL